MSKSAPARENGCPSPKRSAIFTSRWRATASSLIMIARTCKGTWFKSLSSTHRVDDPARDHLTWRVRYSSITSGDRLGLEFKYATRYTVSVIFTKHAYVCEIKSGKSFAIQIACIDLQCIAPLSREVSLYGSLILLDRSIFWHFL